jgi:putative thioredoxin
MNLATMGLTTDEQKAVEQFRTDVVAPSMEQLVILDFWAEWCGPCKQLTPILEKIAAEYADRGVILVKVNVDENPDSPAQLGVRGIPALFLFKDGQAVTYTGERTEEGLTAFVKAGGVLEKVRLAG